MQLEKYCQIKLKVLPILAGSGVVKLNACLKIYGCEFIKDRK
jgi:hypothetical protein